MVAASRSLSIVTLGASGAVGGHALKTMADLPSIQAITVLGRRKMDAPPNPKISQHVVDVLSPPSYAPLLAGHDAAVCTLGVGEPSKMSQAEFLRIDKTAVIDFATACKAAGIAHFELLSSVGADAASAAFYLRTKGEINDALIALKFERLSLFQPSMILTPTNRYGLQQALTLAVWPQLKPLLAGPLRKYRGVAVEQLGAAMAHHLSTPGSGVQRLFWDEFVAF